MQMRMRMRMHTRARCIVLLLASLLAMHCMATLPGPALAQGDEADAGATDATWVLLRPRVSLPPGHDATTDAGIGPEGLPRARCDASLVGVAASGATAGPHALLYGGLQGAGPLGDLWSLDLSTPTDPLWTFIPPVAGAAAPFVRAGAATEFLPDFGSVLLFGGIDVNYENNIHALDVSTGAWRMVEASTADGLSSTGPFARAFTGWKRTADAAQPNEAGDLTYELVLYGGAGDSAGQDTPYDKDQADLWSYFYSRNGTAAPGAANEFYGSWLARDPLVCVEYSEVCTDAQSVGQRFATVEDALTTLANDLSPATFRPSTLVDLLTSLRNAAGTLDAAVVASISSFESLPPEQRNDTAECGGACLHEDPAALHDGSTPHPPHLEGHKASLYNGQLFYFGGYSCLEGGVMYRGGGECYSSDLWVLNLTSHKWARHARPSESSDTQHAPWPSPRAYHSQAVHDGRLFVYGGGYKDDAGVLTYDNKLYVLSLETLLWQAVTVAGTVPPPSWSSSMLVRDGFAFLFGGCTDDATFDALYMLRIDQLIRPENCALTGPGVDKAGGVTAGEPTWFLIETRELLPQPPGTAANASWGELLPWGEQLSFRAQLISSERGLARASVAELGGGRYNVSYTVSVGHVFQLYVYLGSKAVRGSPFAVVAAPRAASNRFIDYDARPTIKGEGASLAVRLRDELGNLRRRGGDVAGAVDPSGAPVSGGNVRLSLLLLPGTPIPPGQALPSWLDSFPAGAEDALTSVVDRGDGSYLLNYRMPKGDFSVFQLVPYMDGVAFQSQGDAVPLTLATFDQHVLNPALVRAGYALTCICAAVVLGYMCVLTWHRESKVVKASSYFFLMALCCGVMVCFAATFLLSVTTDSSCRSYPVVLAIGYVLMIGSLFVKSQRIMSIFTTKKLQVLNLSNLRTGIPVLVLLGMELVFSAVWLGMDPLHKVAEPYVNNAYQTYEHCDSEHKNVWVTFTVIHKAVLTAYGIFLATKTRNVPKAYNESKLMAFSLYNIAFSFLICFLLIYLSAPNDDLDTPYMAQVLTILWCAMWTCSLLIVPRIYYLIYPPGAEFYQQQTARKSGGVSASGIGTLSRKGTFTDRSNSTGVRPSSASSAGGGGGAGAASAGGAAGGRKATTTTAPAPAREVEMGVVRAASSSTLTRPLPPLLARGASGSMATAAASRSASNSAAPRPATGVARIPLSGAGAAGAASGPLPALGAKKLRKMSLADVDKVLPPSGGLDVGSLGEAAMAKEQEKLKLNAGSTSSDEFGMGSTSSDGMQHELPPPPPPPSEEAEPALVPAPQPSPEPVVAQLPPPPPPPPSAAEEAAAAPLSPASPFALRAQPHRPSVDLDPSTMAAFRPPAPPSPSMGAVQANPAAMDSSSSDSDSDSSDDEDEDARVLRAAAAAAHLPPPPPAAVAAPVPVAVVAPPAGQAFIPPPPPGSDDDDSDEQDDADAYFPPPPPSAAAQPPPPQPAFQPPPPPDSDYESD